jgi:ankyrin repeat protein
MLQQHFLMTEKERFFKAIEKGDLYTVTTIVAHYPEAVAWEWQNANNSFPALPIAVKNDDIPMVQFLLAHGAFVDHSDSRGITPLIYAAHNGFVKMGEVLLAHTPAPNRTDAEKSTALMHAADQGHEAFVAILLAHDPLLHLQIKNNEQQTAVMLAEDAGHRNIVQMLKQRIRQQQSNFDDRVIKDTAKKLLENPDVRTPLHLPKKAVVLQFKRKI